MSKIKFGFFSLHFSPSIGGAERSMLSYFKEVSKHIDITVYCFLDENGKNFTKHTQLNVDGVRVIQTPHPIERVVTEYVSKEQPDAIGTMLLFSDPVIHLAQKYGVDVHYFAHGLFEDICQHYLMNTCQFDDLSTCNFQNGCANSQTLIRNGDKYQKCKTIICNSEFTKNIFSRFYRHFEEKMDVMYPYVDTSTYFYKKKNVSDKTKVLMINSQFTKGRNVLVNLANERKDIDFHIADFKEEPLSPLSNLDNVFKYGKVSREELRDLYHLCDVFILPTYLHETFSMTACESIICGTPVVASTKGNLPNIVRHGRNGLLLDSFETQDWLDAILKAKTIRIEEEESIKYKNKYSPEEGVSKILNLLKFKKESVKSSSQGEFSINFERVFGEKYE